MLDLEQINLLPNDMKNRYMLLEKLFDHPGFKYLLEWAKAQATDSQIRELNAPTWEQVVFLRGAKLAYNNFVNIEEYSEREFAELAQNELERRYQEEEDRIEADGQVE
jgi:hypothetical protein